MRMYTLGHYFRSAFRSLFRNSWMTVASVGSVVVGLLVFGLTMLLVWNLNYFAAQVESKVEITVYMKLDLNNESVQALGDDIEAIPGIKSVTLISKEDALRSMEERYGENSSLLAGLREDNPLWDTYKVEVEDVRLVTSVAESIGLLDGIDDVIYGREWVEKLLKVTRLLRKLGLALMGALAIAATFIISNTIRITVFARRREIGIMKYVGATDWFIRWPFVIEGWLLGLLGSVIASGVLIYGYFKLSSWVVAAMPFINIIAPSDMMGRLAFVLAFSGSMVGIVGSTMSLRKFLKV